MNDGNIVDTGQSGQSLAVDAVELARLLHVSVRHVRRMDSAGILPEPFHVGRSVRWLEAEITAWIQAGAPDRETWNLMKGKNNDG